MEDLTARAGAPLAIFGLSAYDFIGPGTQHIFYQGFGDAAGDGHIHELLWDGQKWHHNDLTAETGAPLATNYPSSYIFFAEGTQHVNYQGFSQGDNGRIHELWWNNDDGWHHSDLTADAHDPPLMINTTTGYEFAGQQHVVYEGGDNHIHDLRNDNAGSWLHTDLTAVTGAPGAVSPPTGYAFKGQGTQHVIYLGPDGHIHEMWWNQTGPNNNRWHHNDLTAATRAPLASDQPTGFAYENEGTQHVLYRGTDAHIHELWWNNEGWHHRDLTATVGAPLAESGTPSGYAFVDQGTLHVDYVGTDFHVHEFWRDGNGWHHNDLTAATGAPLALSNPAGYVFVFVATPPTQHVIYIADTHHVIELWWSPP